MYTYQASTDGKTWRTITHISEIDDDLNQLTLGNADILLLTSTPEIDGINTIQADGVKIWDGIFKKRNIRTCHTIEILKWDEANNEKIYRHHTEDYNELYTIFENYIMHQSLPAYERWEDATNDILGR